MTALEKRVLKRIRAARTVAGQVLPDNFVRPEYEGYCLANVANTVLKHFGISAPGIPLAEDVVGQELKGARKLVVLLVDAMGYLALKEQMKEDRTLAFNALARQGRLCPMTSVFPSTTAVCTSSLHTGLPPVGHAITGYRMFVKERGLIGNMIALSPESDIRPDLLIEGTDGPRRLMGVPTVHNRLKRKGVASYCLIRKEISTSGLSQMLFQGAEAMSAVTVADMMVQIRKLLATDPEKPAVIWAYWGQVDAMQHRYGARSDEMKAEVRNVGFSLQQELLKAQLETRASLMVFADHGHVQVNKEDIISLPRLRGCAELLALPPTGTGRSAYLFARAEKKAQLQAYLRQRLAGRALVCDTADALADGIWGRGNVRPEVNGRIGDVLAIPLGVKTFFYPYWQGARANALVGGRHGGMHEDEMLIPFFCSRLG